MAMLLTRYALSIQSNLINKECQLIKMEINMKKLLLIINVMMLAGTPQLFAGDTEVVASEAAIETEKADAQRKKDLKERYDHWMMVIIPGIKAEMNNIKIDQANISGLDATTKNQVRGLCYLKAMNASYSNVDHFFAYVRNIPQDQEEILKDLLRAMQNLPQDQGALDNAIEEIVNCEGVTASE